MLPPNVLLAKNAFDNNKCYYGTKITSKHSLTQNYIKNKRVSLVNKNTYL